MSNVCTKSYDSLAVDIKLNSVVLIIFLYVLSNVHSNACDDE